MWVWVGGEFGGEVGLGEEEGGLAVLEDVGEAVGGVGGVEGDVGAAALRIARRPMIISGERSTQIATGWSGVTPWWRSWWASWLARFSRVW